MGETAVFPDRQGPGPAWHRVEREKPNPGSGWSRLWRGNQRPGEHRPSRSTWPRWFGDANGLPGGAKLRSGRDGRVNRRVTTREGSVERTASQQRRVVRSYDRGKAPSRPGSRPGPPGPRTASGPAGCGKRPEAPECVASAVVDHEPARKQRPARAGTAPREGKALEGGSKERERNERRPRSVGASRRTGGPRKGPCVPRTQPEPSRGARTLRTAPAEVWRPPSSEAAKAVPATRGTRRNGVRRGKNLTRGGPGRTSGSSPRKWWGASARRARAEAKLSTLKSALNSTGGSRRAPLGESGTTKKTPRPLERRGGSRSKPQRALFVGHQKPPQGTTTGTRVESAAGDRGRSQATRLESLERPTKRTVTCRCPPPGG
jgi:hypothetical protein